MSCIECSCCCAVGRDCWVQDRRFGRVCDSRKSCREREECGKLRMRVELRECARTPRASYTFTLALCFVYHFLFTSQMSSCVSYCFICSNVVRPLFIKSANSPFYHPSPRVPLSILLPRFLHQYGLGSQELCNTAISSPIERPRPRLWGCSKSMANLRDGQFSLDETVYSYNPMLLRS